MKIEKFGNFGEFLDVLHTIGFLPGSFPWSGEGVFSVKSFAGEGVDWHSGDAEHDPWEWRVRVLSDCSDIAYGKLFRGKTGYITREWYPVFLSARRGEGFESFEDAYMRGTFSRGAKKVMDLLSEYPALAVHDLRAQCGFSSKERSRFERILTELQMRMYITVCGEAQKLSRMGEPYGWPGAVYCLADGFFPTVSAADAPAPDEAVRMIAARIREVVPGASERETAELIAAKRF